MVTLFISRTYRPVPRLFRAPLALPLRISNAFAARPRDSAAGAASQSRDRHSRTCNPDWAIRRCIGGSHAGLGRRHRLDDGSTRDERQRWNGEGMDFD